MDLAEEHVDTGPSRVAAPSLGLDLLEPPHDGLLDRARLGLAGPLSELADKSVRPLVLDVERHDWILP